MKKALASGLIGLIALGGSAAVAAPAFAQDTVEPTEQTERDRTPPTDEEREARRAERQAIRAERQAEMAELLGMTVDELSAAFQDGMSLADIATQQGVDVQVVIDAIVADKTEHIEAHVAAGDFDADRAAVVLDGLEERVTERVNAEPGERGDRGERGPRGDRGPRGGGAGADQGLGA